MSFWQKWTQDATHAFQDLYGNWILGDDAGESTTMVVVLAAAEGHPIRVVTDSPSNNIAIQQSQHNNGTSAPSPARRWPHPSTKKSYPYHSSSSKYHYTLSSFGVTFCDIGGRAYIQSVEPGSRAERAGVASRDCVQYAAVLAREWKDPLGEDAEEIRQQALEREASGHRITFRDLKDILVMQSHPPALLEEDSAGLVEGVDGAYGSYLRPKHSTVPTTIQVGISSGGTNPCGPLSRTSSPWRSGQRSAATPASSSSLPPPPQQTQQSMPLHEQAPVVVLVFRRTKQRPTQSLPIWPHFRLDDECDVACQILHSLAATTSGCNSQSPNSPLSHDASKQGATQEDDVTNETVEAAAIRGMIQKAHGLAFLRSNKFVLGLSIHAGSGIVIARLSDGTWSAPSAIGVAGVGLGLQLGVEVAHTIIILQTKEALEHFQRGGSFTAGANVGAAVGGIGREAIGAASLSGAFCGQGHPMDVVKDDEYHADTQPPDSQASVGVAPLVAYAKSQGLYIGLSLEGSRIHGRDEVNARTYQFDTRRAVTANDLLTGKVAPRPEAEKLYAALHQIEFMHELQSLPRPPKALWGNKPWQASAEPLDVDGPEFKVFEEKFREFVYGGVYVWRVRGRKRERRTLWLYVPEGAASLQLGFVSKLSNVEAKRTSSEQDDRRSVTSEDVTLDSALMDSNSVLQQVQSIRTHVELSRKHSVVLSDVLCLTQELQPGLALEDPTERRRVISLETSQHQLQFVAKTDQEAHVLMAGLKLLLESETKRCGVRGGVGKDGGSPKTNKRKKGKRNKQSGYASSEVEDNDDASAMSIGEMPESWRSWGRAPGRNYLRGQASANDQGYPLYVHGQLLFRDIAKNVHLPLPLALCRVLLLDSSSKVISRWEKERGDLEFEKTPWTFPPATPREGDQYQSEHQLIASGSMSGAHRTISYQRPRNGQLVRLFETQIVDSDDSEKLAFQIHERMPRRGFSIKVKIILRAFNNECEVSVLGEIRPVGKNMSNPEAVHKAFVLVLDELRERYGPDGPGLLSAFLEVASTYKKEDLPPHFNLSFQKSNFFGEEKKEPESLPSGASGDSKSIKLEDMLKYNASLGVPDVPEPKSLQDRPGSSGPMDVDKYRESYRRPKPAPMASDTFDAPSAEPVMIEVKPLPKIRLSLMPSPREEDEFNLDEEGDPIKSPKTPKSTSSSKSKRTRKSWGKKRLSRKGSI